MFKGRISDLKTFKIFFIFLFKEYIDETAQQNRHLIYENIIFSLQTLLVHKVTDGIVSIKSLSLDNF